MYYLWPVKTQTSARSIGLQALWRRWQTILHIRLFMMRASASRGSPWRAIPPPCSSRAHPGDQRMRQEAAQPPNSLLRVLVRWGPPLVPAWRGPLLVLTRSSLLWMSTRSDHHRASSLAAPGDSAKWPNDWQRLLLRLSMSRSGACWAGERWGGSSGAGGESLLAL